MGVVLGSLIMRKFRLNGRRAALYIGITSLISASMSFSLVLVRCDSVNSQIEQKVKYQKYVSDGASEIQITRFTFQHEKFLVRQTVQRKLSLCE